ncbi:MAG TPA: hypothetical protein VHH88_05795 [Verrucomicrobiae bacterium]|nr:hypothetical protein [Verrucomicrobiae bacterium]
MQLNETEKAILRALIELDESVRCFATVQPKPNLVPLFQQIDALAAKLPPGTDPGLRHYLTKKSYEKARLFLQGRDGENATGNCDRNGPGRA